MFYCDPCGKEKGWPVPTLARSHGRCEVCFVRTSCNDHPSKSLATHEQVAESSRKVQEIDDSAGIWHSTGALVTDGHPKRDCPGDVTCPVIAEGYDTPPCGARERNLTPEPPKSFDAMLFAAYRAGVAQERIAQTSRSTQEGLSLAEVRESFENWRRSIGCG